MGGMTQALRTRPGTAARCQGNRILGLFCAETPKDRPKLYNKDRDSCQSHSMRAGPQRPNHQSPELTAPGEPHRPASGSCPRLGVPGTRTQA